MKLSSFFGIPTFLIAAAGCAFIAAPQSTLAQAGEICTQKQLADLGANPKPPSSSPGAPGVPGVNVPKFAPGEESAYKAFFKLKTDETAKRLETGDAFVRKFPDGPFSEAVYSQLSIAAYQQQNFAKMEEYAAKALAINPDDVTVMVFTGWVIPHQSAAPAELEKAEKYEKRVLELLPNYARPAEMTDQQLAAAKIQYEAQAHSGLGLVAYRRSDFAGAVAELSMATAGASAEPGAKDGKAASGAKPTPVAKPASAEATPSAQPASTAGSVTAGSVTAGNVTADPADYFVLGSSLNRLSRFSDAAAAFDSCAKIPGGEQSACRANAAAARKNAAAVATAAAPKTASAKL
ncbi:MAG TPA: tetratricopeptide repeat protein [Candidatus Acidoferrales bacterium]